MASWPWSDLLDLRLCQSDCRQTLAGSFLPELGILRFGHVFSGVIYGLSGQTVGTVRNRGYRLGLALGRSDAAHRNSFAERRCLADPQYQAAKKGSTSE